MKSTNKMRNSPFFFLRIHDILWILSRFPPKSAENGHSAGKNENSQFFRRFFQYIANKRRRRHRKIDAFGKLRPKRVKKPHIFSNILIAKAIADMVLYQVYYYSR